VKLAYRRMGALAAFAAAAALLCACHSRKGHPGELAVAAAEDEVYAAVVHFLTMRASGQSELKQLVFADTVLTAREPGDGVESCRERTRKDLRLEIDPPVYNSIADKAYRWSMGNQDYAALSPETIQNFLERSCTPGLLSESFRTDLPRTFIPEEKVHFAGEPNQKDESQSIERLFPGAGGVISFSHAGFDSTLSEAIVTSDFVCGMLCGSGHRYILRKRSGRWKVVNALLLWVS